MVAALKNPWHDARAPCVYIPKNETSRLAACSGSEDVRCLEQYMKELFFPPCRMTSARIPASIRACRPGPTLCDVAQTPALFILQYVYLEASNDNNLIEQPTISSVSSKTTLALQLLAYNTD